MSKLEQLRKLREAKYERDRAAVVVLAKRKPITKKLRDAVTKLSVTKSSHVPVPGVKGSKAGRPRVHESAADRQRSYRERKAGA